jgi:hypothetical protein
MVAIKPTSLLSAILPGIFFVLFKTILLTDCNTTLICRWSLQSTMLLSTASAVYMIYCAIKIYHSIQTYACMPKHQVVVLHTDDRTGPLPIKAIKVRLVEDEDASALNDCDGEEAIDGALVAPEERISSLCIPSNRTVSEGELLSDVVKLDNGLAHVPSVRASMHYTSRNFFYMTICIVASGFSLLFLTKGVPIWFASSAQIEQAAETSLACKYLDECECSISTVVAWAYCLAVMFPPLFIWVGILIYIHRLIATHRGGEQYTLAHSTEQEEDRSA